MITKEQFDSIADRVQRLPDGMYTGSAPESLLNGLSAENLEPYRAELERALAIPGVRGFSPSGEMSAADVLARPVWYTQTIPRFFAWMRDEKLGPWTEETPRLPNGFHIGDIVRIAPLRDQECEVVANPTYGESDSDRYVWHENPHYGPTNCDVSSATLVKCPHVAEPITIPGTTFHVGDRVRWRDSRNTPSTVLEPQPLPLDYGHPRVWTDVLDRPTHTPARDLELEECPHMNVPTDRNLPSHYIPWGPEHPDWAPFWEKADKLAVVSRVCTEYDRFVQHMGGPERTTTVTVSFRVPRSIGTATATDFVTLRSGASDLRVVTVTD